MDKRINSESLVRPDDASIFKRKAPAKRPDIEIDDTDARIIRIKKIIEETIRDLSQKCNFREPVRQYNDIDEPFLAAADKR